ncbi:MAG TPA: aldose 1-epimerase family protein, partial [Acidimicrobiales bacterium]
MREYVVGDHAVLDGYRLDEMCHDGRGQVLAPWPNRLAGGHYEFAGTVHQTPLSEPDRGNAIHGLVRWSPWQVIDRSAARVTMGTVLRPQPGYPFSLMLRIEYSLGADGLRVSTSATNVGDAPLPFGLGFHPYLAVGSGTVDSAHLTVPAETVLETDDRGIPTGSSSAVDGTDFDLRRGPPVAHRQFDHCFTGLARDDDGLARATLAAADGSSRLTLWADAAFGYLMVFTGDTLAPQRRRRAVAIEPMTCPPDAFNSGADLIVLEPESSVAAEWGISP